MEKLKTVRDITPPIRVLSKTRTVLASLEIKKGRLL
jgi:hypothetical protein